MAIGIVKDVISCRVRFNLYYNLITIIYNLISINYNLIVIITNDRIDNVLIINSEAGVNPLSTGILSDIFPEKKRALVMSIFNWGIYGGYGIAFPVGRYIPKLDIAGQVTISG